MAMIRLILSMALVALVALALGCDPVDACDEDQRYDNGQCIPCPPDSVVDGDTCVCDDELATYEADECLLPEPDGGLMDDEDAGMGGNAEASCMAYCSFIKGCLGDNSVVQSVAIDVVVAAGVEDQDVTQCLGDCLSTADDPADQAALDCFETSNAAASCDGDQSLAGVEEALAIVDGCCTDDASGLCERLCGAVLSSDIAASMVPACQ